jgi:hypothetical protein
MSSFVAFGSQRISLPERSHSRFVLFVSLCVQVPLSLSLSSNDAIGNRQWEVQVRVLESVMESIAGVVCQRRFSPLG